MTCMTSAWGALHPWLRVAQADVWWAISDGVGHGIPQLKVGAGEGLGDTKFATIPLRNLGQSCWSPLWEPRISWQTVINARWGHPSHSQDITRVPIRCCYQRAALAKHESRPQMPWNKFGITSDVHWMRWIPQPTTCRVFGGHVRTFSEVCHSNVSGALFRAAGGVCMQWSPPMRETRLIERCAVIHYHVFRWYYC